jgi:hypothetical protein
MSEEGTVNHDRNRIIDTLNQGSSVSQDTDITALISQERCQESRRELM